MKVGKMKIGGEDVDEKVRGEVDSRGGIEIEGWKEHGKA